MSGSSYYRDYQRGLKQHIAYLASRSKAERASQLMAFADHIYAASEPNLIGEYLEDEAREWEEDNGGIDLDASEPKESEGQ